MTDLMIAWNIPRGEDLPDDVRWLHYERAKKLALRTYGPGTEYDAVMRFATEWLGV